MCWRALDFFREEEILDRARMKVVAALFVFFSKLLAGFLFLQASSITHYSCIHPCIGIFRNQPECNDVKFTVVFEKLISTSWIFLVCLFLSFFLVVYLKRWRKPLDTWVYLECTFYRHLHAAVWLTLASQQARETNAREATKRARRKRTTLARETFFFRMAWSAVAIVDKADVFRVHVLQSYASNCKTVIE